MIHLQQVTFDADDPGALAGFWSEVTGYSVEFAEEFVARIAGDGSVGPAFLFVKVPERKSTKNRVHVDLGSPDLDGESERVLGLGAELVGRYDEWGTQWATFRDPEGNEFCIGLHDPPTH